MPAALHPPPDPDLARPRAPHDDLTFEELAARYNFCLTSHNARIFTRIVMKECSRRPRPVRVLDVGCGRGIARQTGYQWALRPLIDEYWGIEPDEGITPDPDLFDHHRADLLEDADLPADYFDVAYSAMVMEHVADPDAFMAAMHRCLRPGGVYLFITPNRRHYFTRTAMLLHRLRLDEFVLRSVSREADEYHYPVQYRFNDERRIDDCARRHGFAPPEYAYVEARGVAGYFPRPLRFIYHLLATKRRMIRNPRALISLVVRITRPGPVTDEPGSDSGDGHL
ncbi:MAG: class I SAM-dependent methyltransferase [Planctomycetota bacterium]|jgi:SAM-dependent methyltransferase